MKKYIIAVGITLSIFSTPNLSSFSKLNINLSNQRINSISKDRYKVSFSLKYPGFSKDFFSDHQVPIIVNRYIISGNYTDNKIKERDFLFSQLNMDLNNNGNYKDEYYIEKKSGIVFLDSNPVYNVISKRKFNKFEIYNYMTWNGKSKEIKISENTNPFYIYKYNYNLKKIRIGVSTKKNPSKIVNFPNPNIEINIFKPVTSLSDKPVYKIEGMKNYYTLTNEKYFEDNSENWTGIIWGIKKIKLNKKYKNRINFIIKNIKKPFIIIIYCNISIKDNIRLRSKPLFINMEK